MKHLLIVIVLKTTNVLSLSLIYYYIVYNIDSLDSLSFFAETLLAPVER